MKRLDTYALGEDTWHHDGSEAGPEERQACRTLHTNLVELVTKVLAPLLDRITAHEMETFTMHDRSHGLKVAHLMWHILEPARRKYLTPPEIGMLVAAAHLHDVGMALDQNERNERLDAQSDLWVRLELQEAQKSAIEELRIRSVDLEASETVRARARRNLAQAEEALLAQDTRERHATRARYEQVMAKLDTIQQKDKVRIPNVESCLSFDGDSFRSKLIDVCVSHNQDVETLVQSDETNPQQPRFPTDYPVGSATADLHMIAAALRLADILDFDRERTHPVLFHYLLPGTLDLENRSILEWSKHLAISNWYIGPEAVVFRGRCNNHIIHHAIVQFCSLISEEIKGTYATFNPLQSSPWPFILPSSVKPEITEEGYHYVPYRFELDDERVYELLMGGAIYPNPLVAVRELVQNAVDACKLRDAETRLYESHVQLGTEDRITIRYEEATEEAPRPRLVVTDTGVGMDALILERFFLKVGRSYYRSSEFSQTRINLRRKNLDFAPVSEFGIGFLSAFLLADQVTVETAMWEPVRGDTRKRTLHIDGPTRLIRLDERSNEGRARFKGTRITLYLSRGSTRDPGTAPPTWEEVEGYIKRVCQDLPYRLNLEHAANGQLDKSYVDPLPLRAELPSYLDPIAIRIQVDDEESGLQGEIAIVNPSLAREAEDRHFEESPASVVARDAYAERDSTFEDPYVLPGVGPSDLLRGGFRIGNVPGLPRASFTRTTSAAKLRLNWESQSTRRYLAPNLARTSLADSQHIAQQVSRVWLSYLLEREGDLPAGLMDEQDTNYVSLENSKWLERYTALKLYQLARSGWIGIFSKSITESTLQAWENDVETTISLPLPSWHLVRDLLDIVLPRVTTLRVGAKGARYVKPPLPNWREISEEWRTFITTPVDWGVFAEYVRDLEDIAIDVYPSHTQLWNRQFQDRLASFDEKELRELDEVLYTLDRAQSSRERAELTQEQATLFQRAQNVIGDLEVSSLNSRWQIQSVKLPSS